MEHLQIRRTKLTEYALSKDPYSLFGKSLASDREGVPDELLVPDIRSSEWLVSSRH